MDAIPEDYDVDYDDLPVNCPRCGALVRMDQLADDGGCIDCPPTINDTTTYPRTTQNEDHDAH